MRSFSMMKKKRACKLHYCGISRSAWISIFRRMCMRAMLFFLFESSFQMKLQGSMLAVGKAASHQTDLCIVFSLLLSMFSAMRNLIILSCRVKDAYELLKPHMETVGNEEDQKHYDPAIAKRKVLTCLILFGLSVCF